MFANVFPTWDMSEKLEVRREWALAVQIGKFTELAKISLKVCLWAAMRLSSFRYLKKISTIQLEK
jgi:hypothetical protein